MRALGLSAIASQVLGASPSFGLAAVTAYMNRSSASAAWWRRLTASTATCSRRSCSSNASNWSVLVSPSASKNSGSRPASRQLNSAPR